jgi:hypothetical protein
MTSGFDADGLMTWSDAMSWAGNLSYGGYTDWRLPTSDTCAGYNCTGSEMGHLFYAELGGVAEQSIATTHNTNYNLFQNVSDFYYSGTEYLPIPPSAWFFNFSLGHQSAVVKTADLYAWAVRDGDVATVPLPATAWLFGSGLLGLVGVARARRRDDSAIRVI